VREPLALLAFALAIFVAGTVVAEFYRGARIRRAAAGGSLVRALGAISWMNRRRYGGLVVHVGVALLAVGLTASGTYKLEKERTLKVGESLSLGDYRIRFDRLDAVQNPTHVKVFGTFSLYRGERLLRTLRPGQRFYPNQQQPFASVDARYTPLEDFYLILGAFERDGSSVTVKALISPLIAWMWFGGIVVALGTLWAVWPEGRRSEVRVPAAVPAGHTARA
jgi:cytochrome c-type biogenesis protein CcmF